MTILDCHKCMIAVACLRYKCIFMETSSRNPILGNKFVFKYSVGCFRGNSSSLLGERFAGGYCSFLSSLI
ncbi:MAG: hypothetical protein ACI86P_002512 [Flavobacteriales bacterium]|jgi:hypothetical protein